MLLPGVLLDWWCGPFYRCSVARVVLESGGPRPTSPSDLQEATHLVVEHIPSYLPAGAGASCVTGRQTLLFWFDGTRR